MREQRKNVDPRSLFTHARFDLAAKSLYARFRDRGLDSSWGKQVYAEHLRVWNNLREDNPPKAGLSAYLKVFDQMLDDVRTERFDFDQSPILVNEDGHVLNGGHRVAAAAYYRRPVTVQVASTGGMLADYEYFQQRTRHVRGGLSSKYCDAIANEFCRYREGSVYVVFLFPAAQDHAKGREVIREHADVVYRKRISLNWKGAHGLVRQIYAGEEWVGNMSNDFRGAAKKAKRCFEDRSDMEVLLVTAEHYDKIEKCKAQLRELFGVGKHSVHITDTDIEARRVCNLVFNDNSVHFLNRSRTHKEFEVFNEYFSDFKQWLQSTELSSDDLCIDGSSVLSVYGLRDAADIDVLHNNSIAFEPDSKMIRSHNKEAKHYDRSIDDILYNPNNHFWYDGVKFTSHEVMLAMKQRRNEAKDKRDVRLLKSLSPRKVVEISRKAFKLAGRALTKLRQPRLVVVTVYDRMLSNKNKMLIRGLTNRLDHLLNIRILNKRAIVRKINGYPMLLDFKEAGISKHLMLFGIREVAETWIVNQFVREGFYVLEIGTNIGYYTVLAGHLVGSTGKVIGYEPVPSIAEICKKNVALNGIGKRVEIHNCAVSDRNGEVTLFKGAGNNLNTLYRREQHKKSVAVQGVDIVDVLRGVGRPVDLVRMDLEGFERKLFLRLDAVSDLLPRNILFEVHPFGEQHPDPSFQAPFESLLRLGYRPTLVVSSMNVLARSSFESLGYRHSKVFKQHPRNVYIYRDIEPVHVQRLLAARPKIARAAWFSLIPEEGLGTPEGSIQVCSGS